MSKERRTPAATTPASTTTTVVTVDELFKASPVLSRIFNEARPEKIIATYKLAGVIREIKRHEAPDAPHQVAIEALRDKHSKRLDDGNREWTAEGYAAFDAEYPEIGCQELELAIAKWSLQFIDSLRLEKPLTPAELYLIDWMIDESSAAVG